MEQRIAFLQQQITAEKAKGFLLLLLLLLLPLPLPLLLLLLLILFHQLMSCLFPLPLSEKQITWCAKTTQALSRPSSFPTVPQQHQKQEPEILRFDPFAPTPTSSTTALFPSTAHHLDHPTTSLPQMQMPLPTAQPAQPNSRAKQQQQQQQQQQPLQQPTPTMMDD